MRSIPVATDRVAFLALSVGRAEVRQNPDDRNSVMVPKADRDGVPIWRVQVAAKLLDGVDGDELDEVRAEPFDVSVAGERPKVSALDAIEFDNLVARAWSMADRSGVSFTAAGVRKASPAANGKRPGNIAPPVPAGGES